MGGFPNQNSMFPNGQTQNQPTNPNLISNQTQNLQNSQKSNSDRYAALAELDTEIKQNQIQRQQIIKLYFRINLWFLNTFFIICKKSERHKLQRQVSTGQAIFGAAPSSANPFLSKTAAPTQNLVQNPFGKNPFL